LKKRGVRLEARYAKKEEKKSTEKRKKRPQLWRTAYHLTKGVVKKTRGGFSGGRIYLRLKGDVI